MPNSQVSAELDLLSLLPGALCGSPSTDIAPTPQFGWNKTRLWLQEAFPRKQKEIKSRRLRQDPKCFINSCLTRQTFLRQKVCNYYLDQDSLIKQLGCEAKSPCSALISGLLVRAGEGRFGKRQFFIFFSISLPSKQHHNHQINEMGHTQRHWWGFYLDQDAVNHWINPCHQPWFQLEPMAPWRAWEGSFSKRGKKTQKNPARSCEFLNLWWNLADVINPTKIHRLWGASPQRNA